MLKDDFLMYKYNVDIILKNNWNKNFLSKNI